MSISIMIMLSAVFIINTYAMTRNFWVFNQRRKLRDTEEYELLLPYNKMLYTKWWIWDIKKLYNYKIKEKI